MSILSNYKKGVLTMINYQIMTEEQKQNNEYYPDYEKLLQNATSEQEKEYIKDIQKQNISFAYNMIYITQLKCGHYEIFQTPCNVYYKLSENIKNAIEHANNNKCTRCICNFQ